MPKLPHIVIFNPDQWRGDVLGHMGNPAAVTPTLDALVDPARGQAVSFRNAFCQNPVCTPSRCSFMTGWYPHVRGHRTMFHMLHAEHGEPNLLTRLRENGYHLWWGGKNDLVPGQDGVPKYCDTRFRATEDDFKRWNLKPRPDLHAATHWRGQPGSDTYYSFNAGKLDTGTDPLYADGDWANVLGAIDFLRSAPADRPLCLYLPLSYPHPPYGVEEPWYSLIPPDAIPPRVQPPDHWDDKPSLLRGIRDRQGLQGWTEDRWRRLRATYYGMCARVDHQLSLLLNALKEKEIYDDTALFFFSDHGDFTGDYGLVEKTQNTMEDCLTRVPFIIKPPKNTPVKPRVSDAMVELIDFTATVYDVTGIDPGYDHFGRSLLPLLAGQTDEHRDAVFCEGGRRDSETQANEQESLRVRGTESQYWPRVSLQAQLPEHGKAAMCRTRDYKYVRRLAEKDELYDLRADPGERVNRIDDPALAPVRDRLRDRLLAWYMETCDVVPQNTDKR